MDGKKAQEIKVYYKRDKNYRILPATGAFGGVTPQGEVSVDFFVERRLPPKHIVMHVSPDTPAQEMERDGEERMVRESLVGLVLRPDIALSIGRFLIEKAGEAGMAEIPQGVKQ